VQRRGQRAGGGRHPDRHGDRDPFTIALDITICTPSGSPSASPEGPTAIKLGGVGARYFETSSRNIGCFLTAHATESTVECTVREHEYDDPPKPDDCAVAWIPQFTLAAEASYGAYRGDVGDPLPPVVLAYGTAEVNRQLNCVSEESGLTCRNEDTGHGFVLSRAEYSLF
jgi:hypothetical protein